MVTRLGLTERQRNTYDAIKAHFDTTGMSPSVGEIAKAIGSASKSNVFAHVEALVKRGWLRKGAGARALEIIPEEMASMEPGAKALMTEYCHITGENPAALVSRLVIKHCTIELRDLRKSPQRA